MKTKLVGILTVLVLSAFAYASSGASAQNRSASFVQPIRLDAMRNMGLNAANSDLPVSLPREWGRLVSVLKTESSGYSMFFQSDSGEIYIVNLIQRGQYFYLNTYDNGGAALVIRRSQ